MDKNWTADENCLDDEIELGQRDDIKFNYAEDQSDTKPPAHAYTVPDTEGQSSSQLGEASTFEPGSFADSHATISRIDLKPRLYRSNLAETSLEVTSSISQRPGSSGYANPLHQKKLSFLTYFALAPKEQGYFCGKKPRTTYLKKSERKTVRLPRTGTNTFEFLVGLLLKKARRYRKGRKECSGSHSNE